MGKQAKFVSAAEFAPRASDALRRALDTEYLEPYRKPIADLLREVDYQTSRADSLAEKLESLQRRVDRYESHSLRLRAGAR